MESESREALYPRAPIVEAVVELRFPETTVQKIRKVADALTPKYAHREEEQLVEGYLDFAARAATFKDVTPKYRLASPDQADAFIVTVSNIAWVRLAPYEGWDNFLSRMSSQIPKVLKLLGDPRLSRIGLRYINRIDIPQKEGLCHHEDYLRFRIDAGPLLEPHNGFQWSIQKEFPEVGLGVTVQSAFVESELPNYSAISFDIDVFRSIDVPWRNEDILVMLENMRRLKNEIFEAGITDKAREAFNEPNL